MADRFVCFQIYPLVFHAAPESFDEHVIAPTSLAVHRYPNAFAEHSFDEGLTGELAAQIGVDDFRLSVFCKGFFQRCGRMFGFKRDRRPMC